MKKLPWIKLSIFIIIFIECSREIQKNGLVNLEFDFSNLVKTSFWSLFEIDQIIELNVDATGHYIYPVSKVFLTNQDSTFIIYSRDLYQKLVYVYRGGVKYQSINRWGGSEGIYDFSGVTDCQVKNDSIYLMDYLKGKIRTFDLNLIEGYSIPLPYSYRSFQLLGENQIVFDTDGLSNGLDDDHEVAILNRKSGETTSYMKVNPNTYLQMGMENERYSNVIGEHCYYVRQYDPCIYRMDGDLRSISLQYCLTFKPDRLLLLNKEDDIKDLNRKLSEENGVFRYFCPIQSEIGFGFFIPNSTLFQSYFLWVQDDQVKGYNIEEKNLIGRLPLNAMSDSRFAAFLEQDNTKARALLSDKVVLNDNRDYVIVYRLKDQFFK